METKELGTIVRNWNPETDSVNILKDAFEQIGKEDQDWIFEDAELLSSFWADKYTEYSYGGVSSIYSIIAVDYEGYCIFGECAEVKHVSELEAELRAWEC